MGTFVFVYFWFYVGLFILKLLGLAVLDFPLQRETSFGEAVAGSLIVLALLIWSGILLYYPQR